MYSNIPQYSFLTSPVEAKLACTYWFEYMDHSTFPFYHICATFERRPSLLGEFIATLDLLSSPPTALLNSQDTSKHHYTPRTILGEYHCSLLNDLFHLLESIVDRFLQICQCAN